MKTSPLLVNGMLLLVAFLWGVGFAPQRLGMESMDAMAFNALSRKNKLKYTQEEEKVGSLTYKAAYLPLKLSILKGNEMAS